MSSIRHHVIRSTEAGAVLTQSQSQCRDIREIEMNLRRDKHRFHVFRHFVSLCPPVLSACCDWSIQVAALLPLAETSRQLLLESQLGCCAEQMWGPELPPLSLLPESNKGWGNSDGALIFRTEQRLPPTAHCRAGSIFLYGWLENKRWLRLTDGCCDVIEPEPCVTTGHCWFIRRGIF